MDKSLPFRRGSTWKTDLDAASTGDPGVIYGRTFPCGDNQPGDAGVPGVAGSPSSHGTKQSLILRAVQCLAAINISAGALTGVRIRRNAKLLEASTLNSRSLMQQVSRLATGSRGTYAHFLDDAYSTQSGTTFIANDIVYTIDQGLCRAPTSGLAAQIAPAGAAQNPLTPIARTADGRLGRAQSGEVVLAVSMTSFNSQRTGNTIVVYVGGGGLARYARN
jgi:hypothetical protein